MDIIDCDIHELAKISYVSTSTIYRFIDKLELKGLSQLKMLHFHQNFHYNIYWLVYMPVILIEDIKKILIIILIITKNFKSNSLLGVFVYIVKDIQ